MKNKIALRLSLYFALVLIIFSIVVGTVFLFLFRGHTVQIHKMELEVKANAVADRASEFMDVQEANTQSGGHGMGMGEGMMNHGWLNFGSYLDFISDFEDNDVWVVDTEKNLFTSSNWGHGMMQPDFHYSDLPENADPLISQALAGETIVSEGFSDVLKEPTLTIGVPVKGTTGNVLGVVMLHSPMRGNDMATKAGTSILLTSVAVALGLAILLSIWLSKSFTDPIVTKEAMDALRFENARREFVANISHELKTPITVMRGSLEALVDEVVTSPEQVSEYHHQLLNETVFLQRLVGDLLDLSRLQNLEFTIEKEEISLNNVVSDVVRSMTPLARSKNITIENNSSQDDIILYGDYGRIRQMFFIVLDNAVKFSNHDSVIDVNREGNHLTIKDYGVGISPDELENIFDRFHKSRSEQNKSGSGLGLAIAREIANRHNIEITVHSVLGEGSTFAFLIP